MKNFEEFINESEKELLFRKNNKDRSFQYHVDRKRDMKIKNTNLEDLSFRSKMSNKPKYNDFDYRPFYRFMISKVGTDFYAACSDAKKRMPSDFEDMLTHVFDFDYEHEDYRKKETTFGFGENGHYPLLIVDENNLIQFKDKNYKHKSWETNENFMLESRYEKLYRKGSPYRAYNSDFVYPRLGDEKDGDDLPFKGKMSKQNKYNEFDYSPFFRFMISKVGTDFDNACSEAKKRMPSNFNDVLGWIFDFKFEHEKWNENKTTFNYGSGGHFPMLIVDENNLIQLKDKNYKKFNKKDK